MEATSKKKIPPTWWTKVINDLERVSVAAQQSFWADNTVISVIRNENEELEGYLIRKDNKLVFYTIGEVKKQLPVGAKIKNELPTSKYTLENAPDPTIEAYAYNVVKHNVSLVPIIWVKSILKKIFEGESINMKNDLKEFPLWVALPLEKKKDKALVDLLYRATRYEGLKGLARFNDIIQ